MKAKITLVLIVAANATLLQAGIPEPDMTLFGQVWVGGELQDAQDNVRIIARVEDDPNSLVGAYHMGDNPLAGDYYILRIRLESLADNNPQSNNKALIGQTVDISVRQATYPEVQATSVTVTGAGAVQYTNLYVDALDFSALDLYTDGIINFKDYAEVANNWKRTDCSAGNNWCDGCDIDESTSVDYSDLDYWVAAWLAPASP
jgi:hypothetical protein